MACQGAMGLFRAAPYAPWRPPHPRRFRALPGPKNPDDRADVSPSRSARSSQQCVAYRRSERREKRITGCGDVALSKRCSPAAPCPAAGACGCLPLVQRSACGLFSPPLSVPPCPAAGARNYPFIIALFCAASPLPLPMGEVALRGPRKAKLCGEKAE